MKLTDLLEDVYSDGPGIADDGWDEAYFDEKGLMDWMADVAALQYEIRNARRGSYGVNGDQLVDVVELLYSLEDALGSIIGDLSNDA